MSDGHIDPRLHQLLCFLSRLLIVFLLLVDEIRLLVFTLLLDLYFPLQISFYLLGADQLLVEMLNPSIESELLIGQVSCI